MSPKLFDCFTFNDELELLELRLASSSSFVDRFVLVEAATTFSGAEKPLHFERNRDRFAEWSDQITHVVVDDMPPPSENRWAAEVHQRNSLLRGLEGVAADDVILVSDVDEIVHPEVLATLAMGVDCLVGLEMYSTFRFANWMLPTGTFAQAARAMPYAAVEHPHDQRNHTKPDRAILDAGRHYTTLGGVEGVVAKFENYAHSEMDTERQKSNAFLSRSQRMGVDVFSRDLVSVVPPASLCATQRALLRMRPDFFDFRDLPARHRRELFRWYAGWRARQPQESTLVPELDDAYDARMPAVATRAGAELARHWAWRVPRRGARKVRERIK